MVEPTIGDILSISQQNTSYTNSLTQGSFGINNFLPTSLNPPNQIGQLLSSAGPLQTTSLGNGQPTIGAMFNTGQLQSVLNQTPMDGAQLSTQLPSLISSIMQNNPNLNGSSTVSPNSSSPDFTNLDRRIRVRAIIGQETATYGPQNTGLMGILYPSGGGTNGVVFPFTPTITYNSGAEYASNQPTHANQEFFVFTRAPSIQIQITGAFTAQNQREAQYSLAVMHFCRTMRYMNFGANDPNRGTPPRTLLLSGYGGYIFNDLPVLFKDFSITFDKDVDYVEYTDSFNTSAWIPVYWTLSMTLIVQNTPNRWRNTFNLNDFRSGALMRQKGWT